MPWREKVSFTIPLIKYFLKSKWTNYFERVWFKQDNVGLRNNFGAIKLGPLDIAPTRNCTHFLKIGFLVAGGEYYSYYIHQGNKSNKERKIVRKKLSFMHTKRFNTFFKRWVQFHVYHQTVHFFQNCNSNICIFSIPYYKVIALFLLVFIFGKSSLLLYSYRSFPKSDKFTFILSPSIAKKESQQLLLQ